MESIRRFLLVASLALCFLVLRVPLSGQTVNATLRGTVTDASGGAVPAVHLSLVEPSTGQVVREATSMANGDYEFGELKPGTYELRSTAAGYKMFVAANILLDSGQIRRVDAQLALGEAAEEVTVSAGAALIATESATIQGVFSAKQHDESPQVTIYPTTYSMLTTLSGVQGGTGTPIANGQQQAQQTQTFDGIPNDLQGAQSNNANFFEEVSATLFNAPAESAVPVQINEVTKRGSNSFHGKASYRIYDSVFNAEGFYDTSKTPYIQHEWNIEGGGPIWKDRTFFYGQWFAQRIPLGTQYHASVPTTNWRAGVFATTIIDPTTGQPFANNTIPTSRISSVALAFQNNYLPAPNTASSSQVNDYSFHFPFNSDLYRGDWPIARVDHNLTKNNSFFVRWLMRQTPYVLNDGLPSLVWTRLRRHQQYAAGDTHIFSARLLNNFRFGYSTDYLIDGQSEAGQTPPDGSKVLSTTGLQGSNPSGQTGQGFPTVTITGLTSLVNVPGGTKANNHIITANDSISWQVGRHVWKFGGDVEHFDNFYGRVTDYGTFAFDGSITGSAYADFLLGLPRTTQRTNPLGDREQTLTEYGLYAEDSFKLTRKLSLDYGIRWDLYGTPSAQDHLMYNFDPTTGDVIVDPAALSKVSPLYPSTITVKTGDVQAIADKTNFVPRLGAAYQLSDHSVVRGGYGIYISRLGTAGAFNNFLPINPQLGSTGPFALSEIYAQNTPSPTTPALLSFPNPYPSSTALASVPSQSVNAYPRNISNGHIHQFSGTYEVEWRKIGIRSSYVGSRSTGLNYSLNTNNPPAGTTAFTTSSRPYPNLVSTTFLRFDGGAKYDSLQVDVKRRAGGFTFNANYSYSRSKANFLDTENAYDVLSHWSNDGLTRRHYAVGSVVYALPFGHGRQFLSNSNGYLDRAVGGWSTNLITYLASGTYFSPSFSGSDPSHTNTFGGLPDLVGDPNAVPGGKSKTDWFNVAAFSIPQSGHFGNALPNSLESQKLYLTHLSLIKETAITERVKFQFITQISNLFNHPQFVPPSGSITVAGGNQFTTQVGTFSSLEVAKPRQITFQGGFTF
ncbi:Oar protein [Granulicella sibirica]|uniref:Oar protein n=1 Tax=Granulicella sibirica TaxID=2479048 RepID=A0A4Q0SV27_9BACT|nr:Oar protein [Granulicella sibirica]